MEERIDNLITATNYFNDFMTIASYFSEVSSTQLQQIVKLFLIARHCENDFHFA